MRRAEQEKSIEFEKLKSMDASRKQKACAHSSGEAEKNAAASAAGEAMLIRGVLLLTGLEVRTELLLDSAAGRGICRREGVGTRRHLSTTVLLATAVGETRSGHGWSVHIRGEPRRLPTDCVS